MLKLYSQEQTTYSRNKIKWQKAEFFLLHYVLPHSKN